MPAPRVSVVCIFLDEERFITEAVESVLAQDFDDFELLLVDDGSTDASSRIALDFAGRFPDRVRYLDHEHHANRGAAAARNLGVCEARGELVAFLDADDAWRPAKLREQVAILDARPEAAMVCGVVNYWSSWEGGSDRVVPTGHVRDALSRPPATTLAVYPLGWASAPCPSDVMLRRSAIKGVGGFEPDFHGPLQLYEDQAFFSKLYLSHPVHFASRIWLDYRLHEDSCDASVVREGLQADVRRYFLEWFDAYVRQREVPGKRRVLRAIAIARWEVDHPRSGPWLRRLRRLLWKLRN